MTPFSSARLIGRGSIVPHRELLLGDAGQPKFDCYCSVVTTIRGKEKEDGTLPVVLARHDGCVDPGPGRSRSDVETGLYQAHRSRNRRPHRQKVLAESRIGRVIKKSASAMGIS